MADIDTYPPGFPLPAEDYSEYPDDAYDIDTSILIYTAAEDHRDNERTRQLDLLYPLKFLDPTSPNPNPLDVQVPVGHLRQEVVKKMEQNGARGNWSLVEFVPAWTDPDWNDRFVYTGPTESDDPQVQMYMKPGLLQKQRPALLPGDIAIRGPTEAAKRYGIYPFRHSDPFYGYSGVTPTRPYFEVPLGYARVTPSNQGDRTVVDVDDLNAVVTQFEVSARTQGEENTEDNLRAHLEIAASGTVTNLVQIDPEIANALLSVMKHVYEHEEKEEWQRLLFAGNTSNDVRFLLDQN